MEADGMDKLEEIGGKRIVIVRKGLGIKGEKELMKMIKGVVDKMGGRGGRRAATAGG